MFLNCEVKDKPWYIHTMVHYSAIKWKKLLIFAAMWMNLKFQVKETRLTKIHTVRLYLCSLRKRQKTIETESAQWLPGTDGDSDDGEHKQVPVVEVPVISWSIAWLQWWFMAGCICRHLPNCPLKRVIFLCVNYTLIRDRETHRNNTTSREQPLISLAGLKSPAGFEAISGRGIGSWGLV